MQTSPLHRARVEHQRASFEQAEALSDVLLRFESLFGPNAKLSLGERPSGSDWTRLEVVEHVVLTNHFLGIFIQKLVKKDRRVQSPTHEKDAEEEHTGLTPFGEKIESGLSDVANDGRPWDAPEHMLPKGEPAEQVLRKLREQRLALRAWLRALPAGPDGNGRRHTIRMTVLEPGADRLGLVEMAGFITAHAERHWQRVAQV